MDGFCLEQETGPPLNSEGPGNRAPTTRCQVADSKTREGITDTPTYSTEPSTEPSSYSSTSISGFTDTPPYSTEPSTQPSTDSSPATSGITDTPPYSTEPSPEPSTYSSTATSGITDIQPYSTEPSTEPSTYSSTSTSGFTDTPPYSTEPSTEPSTYSSTATSGFTDTPPYSTEPSPERVTDSSTATPGITDTPTYSTEPSTEPSTDSSTATSGITDTPTYSTEPSTEPSTYSSTATSGITDTPPYSTEPSTEPSTDSSTATSGITDTPPYSTEPSPEPSTYSSTATSGFTDTPPYSTEPSPEPVTDSSTATSGITDTPPYSTEPSPEPSTDSSTATSGITDTPTYSTEPSPEPSNYSSTATSGFRDTPPYSTEPSPEPVTDSSTATSGFTDTPPYSTEPSTEPSTDSSTATSVTQPTCGGHFFDSGSISSPDHPNYYPDNAYCVWQLSAPAGQRILLSFENLELHHCCDCDYIYVYDGSSNASSLLGKLCYNDTTLRDFRSSSSYMTVLFRSDSSGVARGFKGFFSSSLPKNTASVVCSSESMTIVIQRSYLDSLGISWYNLYVDDHRCRPSANSYEVSFNFPIDMCGTSKTTNKGQVVYHNHVRAASSQSGEITRQLEQFLLSVNCHIEQDTTVGIVYKTEVMINSTITTTGQFNASIDFYPSSSFSYPILEFPYEVRLNQDLYVQVQLSRADDTLDLLVDSCVASPNNNFQSRSYTLIQNGCAKDSTVYIYTNGRQYYAQFHFRAFKFLRTHSYVFLQCRVIVCADNDYNSRCRQGCRMRKKRSLDSSHHTETVTLGPITLKGAKSAVEVEKEK
ncbi:CUB and zona pellucida-like domain-containing protein 1 [Colossoma macropomum]|uniref:CUB and zona pellucida-like domain-containing protein 1 n=1 Tax=Colossoma macropomum TaxID=42526 RepID=UPI001864C844|nr:CUB and zona pellucida-like domain-containing protein 1 [Colossoma macropomum]